MSHEKKFTAWLTSELCRAKPAEKFVLRSSAVGSRGSEVDTFEIDGRLELEEIPVYAENILDRAQQDADSNGSKVTRYVVQSIRAGDGKAGARFAFRLRGEDDAELDDETGEDQSNSKGLLGQLMRHNEAMAKTLVMATGSLTATMARRLESADRLNETFVKERTEMFKVLEEAKSDQHSRDMEMMLEDASMKRKEQAFQKLMGLVPLVINKIAGGNVMPDKSDPIMMLLEPLIGSMSGEQFQAIQSALNPDQTLIFVELLQTFQKRKQLAESGPKEN